MNKDQHGKGQFRSTTGAGRVLLVGLAAAAVVALIIRVSSTGDGPLAPQIMPDSRPSGAPGGPVAVDSFEDRSPLVTDSSPIQQGDSVTATDGIPAEPPVEYGRFEGPGATEALRKHRLEELDKAWATVAAARERNYVGDPLRFAGLVMIGMKPLLDEAGIGHKSVGSAGYPKGRERESSHHLHYNDFDYFIPHGQFPVVDRHFEIWNDWSSRSDAAGTALPFLVDEEFLLALEAMKTDAAAAIARRQEMY